MTRHLMAAAVVAVWAGAAAAQVSPLSPGYPQYGPTTPYYQDPYAFGPTNPYNRANQPLSPYLNLLRGGNPAVNYAYGVRPGTGGRGGFGGGAPMMAMGAFRSPYFPQLQMQQQDPFALPTASAGYVLPPAGHPVLFNNTLGYYPTPFGGRQMPQGALAGTGGGTRPANTTGTRR